MSTFKYRILTKGSAVIEGKRSAESKIELLNYLKKSGYIVLKIQEEKGPRGWQFFSDISARKATVLFTQELGILLDSGISMDRSFKILSDAQENNHFKGILVDVLENIKGGKSLGSSLSSFPNIFSNVYVSMVQAGEESGVLPEVLKRLGTFMERTQKIRSELISSLIYPLVLVVAGIISVVALMVFVIPRFSEVFTGIGIALPLSTQIMLNVSDNFVKYGWLFIVLITFMVFLYRLLMRKNEFQLGINRNKLRIPILGSVFWRIEVSRFVRTLGTLLENGVPLLESVDISKGVLVNSYLSDIIDKVKPDIKAGKGLISPLSSKSFFPGIASHLLIVGEETGSLDLMLLKVSDNLDSDIEQRLKRLVSMAAPALIMIMGCGVGVIVISMLSAIFSINDVSF